MNEHLEDMFAMFATSLLASEQARLAERIAELQSKYDLITQELGRRAVDVISSDTE